MEIHNRYHIFIVFSSYTLADMKKGIYMENGSGGFMGNLTFVGGNFGYELDSIPLRHDSL
jgi:hypothetical protein